MDTFPAPILSGFPSRSLDIPYSDDKVMLDYFYLNNSLINFQQKTRVIDKEPKTIHDIPDWDTSMFETFEDIDPRPEMTLKPVAMYPDPFRKGKHKLVLCQFVKKDEVPVMNTRHPCEQFLNDSTIQSLEPWIGWEQEYFIMNHQNTPIGWSMHKDFIDNWRYTSVMTGDNSGFERQLSEYHAKACMFAGLALFGISREECCGQWEFQIGPGSCLEMCDHLVTARYLLVRIAELFGCEVSFKAKAAPGSIWSAGVHLNYSTNKMRGENGIVPIREACQQIASVPPPSMLKYFDRHNGEDNKARLTGEHFAPPANTTIGESDKFAAIRIPESVVVAGKGYMEERRPIGDCDPYMTTLGFMRALYKPDQL